MTTRIVYDIGASNVKFAIMTDAEIVERGSFPTDYSSSDAYLRSLGDKANELNRKAPDAECICISTNGRMFMDGVTYRAYVMKCIRGVNLKAEMVARTNLPVYIINDGSAAALGEFYYGAAKGTKNMLAIVLGSGLGAGLVLNGSLYEGSRMNAAMVFGMLSASGKNGYEVCGITTSILLVMYQYAQMKKIDPKEITGLKFFELLTQGDRLACELFHEYTRNIATVVYESAVLLDLDMVVLTGGIAMQPILVEEVNRWLRDIPEQMKTHPLVEGGYVDFDTADLEIQVVQGNLCADANLYGAYGIANR